MQQHPISSIHLLRMSLFHFALNFSQRSKQMNLDAVLTNFIYFYLEDQLRSISSMLLYKFCNLAIKIMILFLFCQNTHLGTVAQFLKEEKSIHIIAFTFHKWSEISFLNFPKEITFRTPVLVYWNEVRRYLHDGNLNVSKKECLVE